MNHSAAPLKPQLKNAGIDLWTRQRSFREHNRSRQSKPKTEPKRPVLQPVEIVESWPLERYHSPIILRLKGGEDDVTVAKQKTLKSKNR
jgi:hypothetical protein